MIVHSAMRWAAAALLPIVLMHATGCVRRTTTTQDFGLQGSAAKRPAPKAAVSPDAALRATFQQQIRGAFNPLTDDQRVVALQTRLKLNPQDPAARLELAGIYEIYRFTDQALEQYAETLRLARAAPDPAANASLAEQAVMGSARCYQASGNAGKAIPLLEAFLKEWPSPSSWNELGLLYHQSADLAAGENAFRQAVSLEAKSDRFHNNLGHNLLLQNKAEEAESEFRKALELNSKSATSRNNLGIALARRGDVKGALEQFSLAADSATAHNNLAVVLLEMGQYEQSRDELVKALALRHSFAPALANFKLVQERIRERADVPKAGSLPLSAQTKDPENR